MILSKALRGHILIAICIVAGFALVPLVVGERYLLGQIITFFFWAIVASQWNLIMGHGGVFSLAQMFFFACGAYATAMMVKYGGVSIWAALPLAGLISAASAVLIGAACLRLRGAYVALLTYAIATMVQVLIITDTNCYAVVGGVCQELFGGSTVFSGFDDFGFRKVLKANWIVGNYFVVLVVFAVTMLVTVVVIHGRYGLAFRAIRDNLGYASSRGISRFRYQMIVFAISAFFTGVAGSTYAGHFKFAGPSLFDFSTAMMVLSMVIVGGLGSTWGPVIGTAVIMVVIEWMKEFGDARNLGLGLALILFVVFLPGGLAAAAKRLSERIRAPGRTSPNESQG
jgi:branched-chain amino acid transport system permease protein